MHDEIRPRKEAEMQVCTETRTDARGPGPWLAASLAGVAIVGALAAFAFALL